MAIAPIEAPAKAETDTGLQASGHLVKSIVSIFLDTLWKVGILSWGISQGIIWAHAAGAI